MSSNTTNTTRSLTAPDALSLRSRLFSRQLEHYPDTRKRIGYLAIVVIAAVLLYYQVYVTGGVGTRILRGLHMSFLYLTALTAVGNAIGAFASPPAWQTVGEERT
jgi:hypothetical protein